MNPIRVMSDTEITCELLDLAKEAGQVERRMILKNICGSDGAASTYEAALEKIRELVGYMPPLERQIQLVYARTLVAKGQRLHGTFDLRLPRKGKPAGVDTLEELADAVIYEQEDAYRGQGGDMEDEVRDMFRRRVTALLRKELI